MTTRFAKVKKLAGLTILAAAMSAVGLSLGSGTAQANPMQSCPPPHMMFCTHVQTHLQRVDNQFDRIQTVFGVGEGNRFDNAADRFFGVK
jgi:hypothetical protein